MIHLCRKFIAELRELDTKFGHTDDGLKALILEKKFEKLFGGKKYLGCWVREISDNKLSIGHSSATVTVKKTASNSCEVELEWMPDDHPNWKMENVTKKTKDN